MIPPLVLSVIIANNFYNQRQIGDIDFVFVKNEAYVLKVMDDYDKS